MADSWQGNFAPDPFLDQNQTILASNWQRADSGAVGMALASPSYRRHDHARGPTPTLTKAKVVRLPPGTESLTVDFEPFTATPATAAMTQSEITRPPLPTPAPRPTATSLPPQPVVVAVQPQAEAVAASQLPRASLAWDERLDWLGVTLELANAAGPRWRLIKARWMNEKESGGKHHIYVDVLDEHGDRIIGQAVTVFWADDKHQGKQKASQPMSFHLTIRCMHRARLTQSESRVCPAMWYEEQGWARLKIDNAATT